MHTQLNQDYLWSFSDCVIDVDLFVRPKRKAIVIFDSKIRSTIKWFGGFRQSTHKRLRLILKLVRPFSPYLATWELF